MTGQVHTQEKIMCFCHCSKTVRLQIFHFDNLYAVNQGNWSLSIELRLECFVIVAKCKQYAKALTYSPNDTKIQGCLRCQYFDLLFK